MRLQIRISDRIFGNTWGDWQHASNYHGFCLETLTKSYSNMMGFQNVLYACSLVDMGFLRLPFMWSNLRTGIMCIKECLDRSLGIIYSSSGAQNL